MGRLENEYEQLVSWLKANNYLVEGMSLECPHCKQPKLRMSKCWYEEPFGLMEFAITCDKCAYIQGYWSHGNWTLWDFEAIVL